MFSCDILFFSLFSFLLSVSGAGVGWDVMVNFSESAWNVEYWDDKGMLNT